MRNYLKINYLDSMKNMETRNKTVVIADDITGAAEIAGVALRHGVSAVLTTNIAEPIPETDVFIIATDTRSGNEDNARNVVEQISKNLKDVDCQIFKKTDSVLRGHIIAELQTIVNIKGFDCALLLPQNPSKGRVIIEGKYLINNVPLDKTDFRNDPEFPSFTSCVEELLKGKAVNICVNDRLKNDKSIQIADASNAEELKTQLNKAENMNVLLAGGADLFDALLQKKYPNSRQVAGCRLPNPQHSIIVCGSTQSKSIANEKYIQSIGAQESIMPMDVFKGGSAESWINEMSETYKKARSVIVTVGEKENGGSECAVRLRTLMAEAAFRLVAIQQPDLLIIEGGATAFAILSHLNWNCYKLKNEYASGIVSMTYGNTEIILKPGSYPWGTLFK